MARLEAIAWDAYQEGRKAPRHPQGGPRLCRPRLRPVGRWRATRDTLLAAQAASGRNRDTPSRVLLVCGSARNDGTCPGEMSKTFRLVQLAQRRAARREGIKLDLLDLSRLTSEYDRHIHPCKGCVSTAMPLCHWPCSCYPNHALAPDRRLDERDLRAVGARARRDPVTPVYWYQAASPLKLMMDRLVCADGGNPDPTSTHGKKPEEAKALELKGWDYPKHLAGRTYGVVVHGDVAGIEGTRRALCDWLDWMGLIDAGAQRAAGPLHRLLRAVRDEPRRARPGHRGARRGPQRGASGGGRRARIARRAG